MADRVEIPIDLTVENIKTGAVDTKELENKLNSQVQKIADNLSKIFGNIDTSKMTKSMTGAMSGVEQSYKSIVTAVYKYSEAMTRAGESSAEYKAKVKSLAAEQKLAEEKWLSYQAVMQQAYDMAKATPEDKRTAQQIGVIKQYEGEYRDFQKVVESVRAAMPKAEDYVATGTDARIRAVAKAFDGIVTALQKLDTSTDKWQQTAKDNRMTDEYMQMSKQLQTAESKLDALVAKAQRMKDAGTGSESAWKNLVAEANTLDKEIQNTNAKMRSLVNTGNGFRLGAGQGGVGQELFKLNGNLTRTEKMMNKISSIKPNNLFTNEYNQMNNELTKAKNKLDALVSKAQKLHTQGAPVDQWKTLNAESSQLSGQIDDLVMKMSELVKTGAAFQFGTGDAQSELQRLDSMLNGAKSSMDSMGGSAGQAKAQVLAFTTKFSKALSQIGSKLGNVIKQMLTLGKTSRSTSSSVDRSMKKLWKNFLQFGLGFRSMYFLIRRLRTTLITMLGEMSKRIPEVNQQLSAFKTATNQLKGSLATMAQPIISAILPALTRLCAALNTAMETLARFFATLTGQGYIYKFTADQVDYAESLDKTTKSAKEAKKSLMGFDELNVLNGDNNSGSGSSSGDGAGGSWAKEMIDGQNNFAQMIKDAWAKADFTEVGQYIGEKLLGALTIADNWINTKGKPLASKIATSFATLINGFVSVNGLAEKIGETVGDAIEMGLTFVNDFFDKTNWDNVGQFIAGGLNSAIKNFDWALLGDTFASAVGSIITLFWKVVTEFDWTGLGQGFADAVNAAITRALTKDNNGLTDPQKLGQAISRTVRGILNALITFVQKTDWESVGVMIGQVISEIDWGNIAWDFVKLVGAVVSAICKAFLGWAETDPLSASIAAMLGTAILGIKVIPEIIALGPKITALVSFFKDVGAAISLVSEGAATLHEALELAFGPIATTIAGIAAIVAGAILAFTNFFSMLKEGFSWVKEILMVIGIALAAVGAVILGVPATVAAAVAAVVAVVATAVVFIVQYWDEICEAFREAWEWIKENWNNFWSWVTDWAKGAWDSTVEWLNGIKQSIIDTWNNMVESVKTFFGNIVKWITDKLKAFSDWWSSTWTGIKDKIVEIWNKIKGTIVDVYTSIRNWINEKINNLVKWWSEKWDAISKKISDIWNAIKETIFRVYGAIRDWINEKINNLVQWWSDKWNTIRDKIINTWNKIKETIVNVYTSIKTWITEKINDLVKWWSEKWDAIKKKVADIWDGISKKVKDVFNAVKNFITSTVDAISSKWSSTWDNIKKKVTDVWDGIKQSIKNTVNGIIGIINKMISAVVGGINSAIGVLNKFKITIPADVPVIGGKSYGFNISTLTAPQIPYLAQGAVIPPNKEFLAMLGDQKHGTNIEAPLDTIKQAVAEELEEFIMAMMGGFSAVVDAIDKKDMDVIIGDRDIGRAYDNYKRESLVRTGR